MTRARVKNAVLALGLVLLAWPGVATGQSRPPRDPMVIRRQLEQSLELQQKTMALLTEQPDAALKTVWEAYVQMRAAHGAMTINASNMSFPDPLFPLTDKRVNDARALLLSTRDMLRSRGQRDNAIEIARTDLVQAMRLTQIILATIF
jgi:hypothetical protein